jgi:hypothetical protein
LYHFLFQERQRADDAVASVRILQQRIDEANKALAVQKQFGDAAAAVAAAQLHTITQRAVDAEKQAQSLQDTLNSNQVRGVLAPLFVLALPSQS